MDPETTLVSSSGACLSPRAGPLLTELIQLMYRIRMPVFPFRASSETAAAWQLGFPPSPFCACRQAAPPTRLPLYKFIMNQAPELLLKSLKFPKVLPEFMPTRYQILIRKQLGELGLRRAVCSQTHGFNRIRGVCTIKRQMPPSQSTFSQRLNGHCLCLLLRWLCTYFLI